MRKNINLRTAKRCKNDEFYTQLSDIQDEVENYIDQFKDKIVYLNCDDPTSSNFWLYFKTNFQRLGLKRLISTHYEIDKPTYKLVLEYQGNQEIITNYPLNGDGDFCSPECLEILDQCDIVVTNPPFSLSRKFVPLVLEHKKKMLVIGHMCAITCRNIFNYIKDGYLQTVDFNRPEFRVPSYYEKYDRIDDQGNKYTRVQICWYTNLDIKPKKKIPSITRYIPENYVKYDGFDAIEVSRIKQLPVDYDGTMGVPITILKFDLDEYYIVETQHPSINGRKIFFRVLIRRK